MRDYRESQLGNDNGYCFIRGDKTEEKLYGGEETSIMIVVNIKYEGYDVYGGRPGRGHDGYFGNRHVVGFCPFCGFEHDRGEALRLFRRDFDQRIQRDPEYKSRVLALKGKRVGCFCVPDHMCHLDIIADWVNNQKS